jgi:hypothetical protein
MTDLKQPAIDLPVIYSKLLWKAVNAEPGSIEIGASTFDPISAAFDDPAGSTPVLDAAEYGVVGEISSSRFLSLAAFNPFERPAHPGTLRIPVLYLYTDDERKSMSVADVGGVREVLRYREENGDDAFVPVILFIENNQQPVRGCEVGDPLLEKLRHGVFARNGHGRPGAFVQGSSFEHVHVQAGTSDDYEAYDLSPDQWADAMRRHVEKHFGPLQLGEFVTVGEPGW